MALKRVFDTTELTLSIGTYLSRNDLVACTLVSSDWNHIFTPLVWNSLIITTPAQNAAFLSKAGQHGLFINSLLVRSLETCNAESLEAAMSLPHSLTISWHKLAIPASFQYSLPPPFETFTYHSLNLKAIWLRTKERLQFENEAETQDLEQARLPYLQAILLSAKQMLAWEAKLATFFQQLNGLRMLDIMTFPFDQGASLRAVVDSLPRLERLQLANQRRMKPDLGALQYLLSHLGKCISYFGLSAYFCSISNDATVSSSPSGVPTLPMLPRLNEILIDGKMRGLEEDMFLPLIKRCSQLKKISVSTSSTSFIWGLSKALKSHCPLLDSLIVGHTDAPIDDEDCAKWLEASQAWKELSFQCVTGFGSRTREAVLQHSSTLESFTATRCLGQPPYFFMDILQTCPNLKKLNPFDFDSKGFAPIKARAFAQKHIAAAGSIKFFRLRIDASNQSSLQQESTAATLQSTLPLLPQHRFAGPSETSQINNDHTVTPGNPKRPLHRELISNIGVNGIMGLRNQASMTHRSCYGRLATMTDLEELWLGDPDIDYMNTETMLMTKMYDQAPLDIEQTVNSGLDLSLESGLDLMSGMDKLRILGVHGLPHRIGIEELRWMVREWPKLRRIHGLFWRRQSPEMVQWIQENAPFLQHS